MKRYIRDFTSVFFQLWWSGCDYFCVRRFDVRMSWFIAGVVARTCREIREERA